MAYKDSKKANVGQEDKDERLRLYAAGALVLAVLAAISVLLIPSSSSAVSRCNSLLFQQDRYECIESAAVSTHNSTMCGSLYGAYADSCYMSIALNTTNPQLCGKINSTAVSDECYIYVANYTSNPSLCSKVGGALGSECAYHMAVDTNDTQACALVNGTAGQLECRSTIYFNNAIGHGSASSCASIYTNNDTTSSEGILQNSSIGRYAGLSFNITKILEFAVFQNQTVGARDICYTGLAYESHNSTYCKFIQNSNLTSVCTEGSAIHASYGSMGSNSTLNMTALLNSCNGQPDAAECRYSYMSLDALETGNVTICKNIPSGYSSTCWYYLAEKYNSTSYCSYISNTTLNTACVGDIEGLYPTSTNTSD